MMIQKKSNNDDLELSQLHPTTTNMAHFVGLLLFGYCYPLLPATCLFGLFCANAVTTLAGHMTIAVNVRTIQFLVAVMLAIGNTFEIHGRHDMTL